MKTIIMFYSRHKNKLLTILPLLISICIFLSFGFYHITKFETVDEKLWKYDRIEKYFTGISEGIHTGVWKKTRINDKPGVSVAIVSGIGLLFSPDPNMHEDYERENLYSYTNSKGKSKELYTIFRTEQTEKINFALRAPLLLFNALVMLPLLFWLMYRAFEKRVTAIAIILMGLSPIIIGISQIINPDTLLWSFATVSMLSFLLTIRTNEKKFLLLCGISTGLALLSKYTANLLFIFFPLIFLLEQTAQDYSKESLSTRYKKYAYPFISVAAIASALVVILMPAVLQKPQHFLYATIYSPVLAPLTDPFIHLLGIEHLLFSDGDYRVIPLFFFTILTTGLITLVVPLLGLLWKHFSVILRIGTRIIALLLLLIFVVSIFNANTSTSLFSLDDIKEVSSVGGELTFPQLENYAAPLFWFFSIATQLQNFIFGLHPFVVFATMFLLVLIIYPKRQHDPFMSFIVLTPFVFALGGIFSGVFVNARYGIMLFPLFALFAAYGIVSTFTSSLMKNIYTHHKIKESLVIYSIIAVIIVTHLYSLFNIKPFFFNYQSSLLPKEYVVTDAWGYGYYEAAIDYLNTLPDAENIIIWSDRGSVGVCQFFVGKCVKSTIDLDRTGIDYFVFTRRGMIRNRFGTKSSDPQKTLSQKYYYSTEVLENPAWEINVGDRPKNYVKVIKVENENK